jgi:hypothetical protein
LIYNNQIYIGMIKDVGDVVSLKPVVDAYRNGTRSSNAVEGFKEGGGVGTENADSFV